MCTLKLQNNPDLVVLGELGRAQGLRGELRINYYATELDLLKQELFLQDGQDRLTKIKIASYREQGSLVIVRLAGCENRTQAELLRGQKLLISRESLPELDAEEVYVYELEGLQVFVLKDDHSQEFLGTLEHIEFQMEQETWVIVTPENKEVLLPAVPEFVADIDVDAKRILITPPPGLLELYL